MESLAKPLYNSIGTTYDATRRADPAITRTLAELVGVRADAPFLDLACGTGNYTCALATLGGRWHGVDISDEMLAQASSKSRTIEWKLGSADAIPYPDGAFAGAVCTLAIHHFPELRRPFQEVFRVLDEGPFVLFTSFPEQTGNYWLRHYFPEMMERSIRILPPGEAIQDALLGAGFEVGQIVPFYVTDDLQDLFLYSAKERPQSYLDPVFRANISSFAAFCSPEELESGLQALRSDLDDGSFRSVAAQSAEGIGDYAFVVAHKRRVV